MPGSLVSATFNTLDHARVTIERGARRARARSQADPAEAAPNQESLHKLFNSET
jgi:hypothetical protein